MKSSHLVTAALVGAAIAAVLAGCGSAADRKAHHFQRGERYLAAREYGKAAVEFRNALQIDPNFRKARLELGRVSESLGNPGGALGQYLAVLEADPANAEARVLAARVYLLGGLTQKALDLVNEGLAADPANAQLLTVRGAAHARMGDASAARADAEEAYRRAPEDEYAIALLAAVEQRSGQVDEAIKLIKGDIARHPANIDMHQVLVDLLLQQKDFAGAEAELTRIVSLEPNDLSRRYALGQFYLGRNNVDAAERTLRDAIAVAPSNDGPKLALVELLAGHRGTSAAETALADFSRAQPEDYGLRLALARYLEQEGKAEQAERSYLDVIAHAAEPSKSMARDRLAALYVRSGKAADAAHLVNAVLQDNPRDAEALLLRADMASSRGDPAAAVVDLRAALRDQPNSLRILQALARAHLANNQAALAEEALRTAVQASPKDVGTRVQLAELLEKTGKSDEARALLVQVTNEAPANVAAQEALFGVQAKHQDYQGARATASAVIRALPQQGIGNYLLGMVDEADGKPEAAAREYQTALTIQPAAVEPLAALVKLDLARGDSKRALELVDSTIARSGTAIAHNLRAQVLESMGRREEAIKSYQQALALAPGWWAPYQNLSRAQMAARQRDDAIATLVRGVAQTNDNYTLAAELAAIYELEGKPDQAIAVYEGILARNPTSVVAASSLAMLLVSYRADPPSLERARTLASSLENSTNPMFQDTLGWVRFKSGDYQQALTLLRTAFAASPGSMLIRYHLGMAQLKTGDRDDARKNIEVAVTSGRPFLGLSEAKIALSQLTHNG